MQALRCSFGKLERRCLRGRFVLCSPRSVVHLHALKKPALLPGAPFIEPVALMALSSMIVRRRTIML